MAYSADCAVIGAGVIGSSIAYQLTKRGFKTILIERLAPGQGATRAAAGMLAAECEAFVHPELAALAMRSRNMFGELVRELEALTGLQTGYVTAGFVIPARTPVEAERLSALADKKDGAAVQWWDAEEISRRIPGLKGQVAGGLFREQETQLLPQRLTRALVAGAEKLGAELLTGTTVHEILTVDNRVRGVKTSGGHIVCPKVVFAGGLDELRLLRTCGIQLDMYPVKGEVAAVTMPARPLDYTIYAEDVYLVPKPDGELWIGATSRAHKAGADVSAGGLQHLLTRACAWLPEIRESSFLRAWSGLRPQTRDGLPFIGPVPDVAGLYAACGHYRNGILLSAATGEAIADFITGLTAEQLKLMALSPERVKRPPAAVHGYAAKGGVQ
ncbi:glycine oxidase ThiO [Paenibacillus sp. P96]|uniref:glycine oxidase n=1 Tax=Paenibacillus zeirhizosphaerae TaxID=2987519 RepID=A0ABT9FV77_9BACL|nr:glycine oxidase ThiO [Paenibacillus sp. P96]MDP4098631.1 glycine oxidase ThiO [Paenibacillus sp. P96]